MFGKRRTFARRERGRERAWEEGDVDVDEMKKPFFACI
jgi:hypothetical protein